MESAGRTALEGVPARPRSRGAGAAKGRERKGISALRGQVVVGSWLLVGMVPAPRRPAKPAP